MKRLNVTPRQNWIESSEELGFTYHSGGKPDPQGLTSYWDESVAYQFTAAEVDKLELATEELHQLCLKAVDYIINKEPELLTTAFKIPTHFHDYIKLSWRNVHPSLYGRFDLAYDGNNSIKMLEYNADTPTLVLETAIVQWHWLQALFPKADQFNSLHEKLLDRYKQLKLRIRDHSTLYFTGFKEHEEESQTLLYMQDLAQQAGHNTAFIQLKDIGWNGENFTDLNESAIKYWFKLYPWEWMMTDEFGKFATKDICGIMEPAWKMLLSNKAILAVLWKLFPDHPNLCEAKFTPLPGEYIRKPILSREGANMTWIDNGRVLEATQGDYNADDSVYQAIAPIYQQDGHRAILGSWIVNETAAGMIIRDSDKRIVTHLDRVVPHYFE